MENIRFSRFGSPLGEMGAMEYFLLALIGKAGLTSLYELQQRAGLQPGGIRMALSRLEQRKLVVRADSSIRMRRELSLTPLGEETLKSSWRTYLRNFPQVDAVLRMVSVALLMEDSAGAADYLAQQAKQFRDKADQETSEAAYLESQRKDALSIYAWMRCTAAARQRGGEAETLAAASKFLKLGSMEQMEGSITPL